MITKFKIFESQEGVKFLDVESNICGICGTEGNYLDINDMDHEFEKYYKCPNCDFEWCTLWTRDEYGDYEGEDLYSFDSVYTMDGTKLNCDDNVPAGLYNEIKLQANKYNL